MKTEYDFFMIEREQLKGKNIFPFQLYIFNPFHKNFSMFLNGNRPITKELDAFLDYLLEKGGKIAILKKQSRTFLTAQELNESDIPSLKRRTLHELEMERVMNLKLREIYEQNNGVFNFISEFAVACETDNFEKIIEFARLEIVTFSVTQSHTISLATHLSKMHLNKDNYLNRVVATSYLFAKMNNIEDPVALADVVCGTFLSHIGYTQLGLSMIRSPVLNLDKKQKKLFEKHTILGNHLIKKSHLDLSERCKALILDHHERISGGGYPAMKYGDSIESLAMIVGSISHLFEFSSGKINENKQKIKSVILAMKNKSFFKGLEIDFSDKINISLENLINTDEIKNIKAS